MPNKPTNEFSIVLLTDDNTYSKVEYIRKQLPPSPVRVDPPHMTLLRGISSPESVSNGALITEMRPLVLPFLSYTGSIYVKRLITRDSHIYGPTAIIELEVPKKLIEARDVLVQTLLAKGYSIETLEQNSYSPHITLTLSVPLPDGRNFEDIIPNGHPVNFSGFALFRLKLRQNDGTRLVNIVSDISV